MPIIDHLGGLEILDSRGRPTVRATCRLEGGIEASASVPSGASSGRAEAAELRDGDPRRYGGLGCRRAVEHVSIRIARALAGRHFGSQADLDGALLALDGTPDKTNLGANALLAVSLAFARACARAGHQPLYRHFAELVGQQVRTLPRLTINLFSGGRHAGGQVAVQDVLIVPAMDTIDEGLATAYAIYQAAATLVADRYGTRPLAADEGGLAPAFDGPESMLQDAVDAIEAAGFEPGRDVFLAVDVAASHFHRHDRYRLGDRVLESAAMIDVLTGWADRYPLVSIEDGLAEDDWTHWPVLRRRLAGKALTVGDDLLCTNPARIRTAIDVAAADALLLKVNQIGTLTEAGHAWRLAREAGWQVTVSARSGETEDDWLADLSVGWQGDQIKVGSITRSERLAKYNRLLAIERETRLPVNPWPARSG